MDILVKHKFEQALRQSLNARPWPRLIAEPVRYLIESGGKRLRPRLTLLSAAAVGGKPWRALPAAVALELLHTFTLVHDDIMDNAPTRRGRPTIHTRWNINTAILAGDTLAGLSYLTLAKADAQFLPALTGVLSESLVIICAGQALDEELKLRTHVSRTEYFTMIEKKTATLFSTALLLGALGSGAPQRYLRVLKRAGRALGMAFQIKDDLLDVAGNAKLFGKTLGGDIREGKKTFLLVTALERVTGPERKIILAIARRPGLSGARAKQLSAIKKIYERHGVLAEAERIIRRYSKAAQNILKKLPPSAARAELLALADKLTRRVV